MTAGVDPPVTKRPADGVPDGRPAKALKGETGAAAAAPPAAEPPPAPLPSQPHPPSLAALLVPVPPRWDDAALRAWLASMGITRIRVARKKRGANLAFLSFGSVADRVAAGAAVAAAPHPPPGMKKGSRPAIKDDARRIIVPAADLDVRDVVAPLWKLPYAAQLARKWAKVAGVLGKLAPPPGCPAGAGAAWAAALTPVGILRSPATRGYRNKCEFSVGPGTDPASPVAVGFCLGAYRDGVVEVGPPGPAPHVSPTAAAAADAMAAFINGAAAAAPASSTPPPLLPAWDKAASSGFWRLLTVREARRATPMPAPGAGGAGAVADLLEEGLADQGAACPPFVDLQWERWLVPAGALPKEEDGGGGKEGSAAAAAPAASLPPSPPPPLPPPDEVMMVIQVDPTGGPPEAARTALAALGERLASAVAAVAVAAGRPAPTTSVWVQHHSGPSNAADEGAPLMRLAAAVSGGGDGATTATAAATPADPAAGCLTDTLAGLAFRISPSSFFQVNAPAAALLYRAAVAWADPGPGDVVLDVCCGTGTLGVCAAAVAKAGVAGDGKGVVPAPRVLGVDITPSAIADAAANAAANGLDAEACAFVAGRAEDVMSGLLERATSAGGEGGDSDGGAPSSPARSLVAIVDPPRAGLHPKVTAALKGCPAVKRIVYVSCNVESQVADCARLCGNGGGGGHGACGGVPRPFRPVQSLAVDLFPHTAHVESVLMLERD